jgi:hypothetical protein
MPSSSTVTVGCQSLVPPRGDKAPGVVVLGRSLPTWLTVTEAPTVVVVCLTCNRVKNKKIENGKEAMKMEWRYRAMQKQSQKCAPEYGLF